MYGDPTRTLPVKFSSKDSKGLMLNELPPFQNSENSLAWNPGISSIANLLSNTDKLLLQPLLTKKSSSHHAILSREKNRWSVLSPPNTRTNIYSKHASSLIGPTCDAQMISRNRLNRKVHRDAKAILTTHVIRYFYA